MEHFAASTLVREPAIPLAPDDRIESELDRPTVSAQTTSIGHPGGGSKRSRWLTEGRLVFVACFALYAVVGALLDFHYESYNGDAVARMANAFYILYSRDRHISAIGFVWNPGTSIVDFFPLLFYKVWSPLASHMYAGSLASAACMAGAVYQLRCTLAEWGVARIPRLVLVAIFALNAMIVYYGGNGMSEGIYLFTLVATSRYLLRWLRQNDLHSLVYAASALGVCYIARNEAVGPAMLAGAVVFGVAWARSPARGRRRIWAGLADFTIFEIPFGFAFVGWAIVSWVITGTPFGQFTSIYGTASQLKVIGDYVPLKGRILQDVHDVFYLAPAIPLIILVALFLAWRRRDIGILAPLAVVGGGLAFDLMALVGNKIDHWFRYFITAVPLEVLLVGSCFATVPALLRIGSALPAPVVSHRWLKAGVATAISLLLLIPASVTTVRGMTLPKVGYEESQDLGFIFLKHLTAKEKATPGTYPAIVKMVDYLARQKFSNGQVLVDNFSGCIPNVIVGSPNPDIFVIPNDRDFQRTLADPLTFHTHYILDADPIYTGALTAPNTTYPSLWSTGAGFAKLVHTFPAKGICEEFRLFKVTGHPALRG